VEVVLWSDTTVKINKKGLPQERHLVVTSINLYNFEPNRYTSARRSIAISQLGGLVLQKGGSEILIQVKGEYDYRYEIVRQADFVKSKSSLRSTQC
jgi:hypothetical protein